ncbi:hypothetical protein [Olene mendosa nucleopolyhedrovirus]|uniref:Uncharacterized protein n=1 Tax=Olene mendosa nucleopolyhedrovirus TaxID=2933796 RepID=A0AAX3AVG9_9ABAC|nr:hypothetical protein QKV28_gp104 [Olene mendosa nucleopolyhedrovirus]UOQ18887.1 hypothetical protein [Olene mendosa nucleopolyhedrovirus]
MSMFNNFMNLVHLQGIYGMSKWYERSQWHKHNSSDVERFLEFKLKPIVCQGRDFMMTDKSYKTYTKGLVQSVNTSKKHYNPYIKNCNAAIRIIMDDNPHVDWKKVKKCFCKNYMNLHMMHSLFEKCQIHICQYDLKTILDALRIEYDEWQIKLQSLNKEII